MCYICKTGALLRNGWEPAKHKNYIWADEEQKFETGSGWQQPNSKSAPDAQTLSRLMFYFSSDTNDYFVNVIHYYIL